MASWVWKNKVRTINAQTPVRPEVKTGAKAGNVQGLRHGRVHSRVSVFSTTIFLAGEEGSARTTGQPFFSSFLNCLILLSLIFSLRSASPTPFLNDVLYVG